MIRTLQVDFVNVETGETTDTALEMKLIVSKNNEGTAAVSFNDLGSSQ